MVNKKRFVSIRDDDALWYKDAVIYELRPGAFKDGNNDGVGDFKGLIERLDYLQHLGVTVLWLLPFYPSPWRDDGYDISDYTSVHPAFGDLDDFKRFLSEAHCRGMRVITELVVNHTSDRHPWFRQAREQGPGSRYWNYYVWSPTPDLYRKARVIFKDYETSNWSYDRKARAYYWHRFYSHQPDLNFDHPPVREAVFQIVDFWLELGVDGLRLDTAPYLFEREGTACENLPETLGFLRDLRARVDRRFERRVLLAEANQQPTDSMDYFGAGDACQMAFHFPLMPRLFLALCQEDRSCLERVLARTASLPVVCQWALFLRNHDELSLEMVTEQEREALYKAYAPQPGMRLNLGIRRRLAPLLDGDRRKIELMHFLLFTLPGTPVIYYGDEIGMGDDLQLNDRNGLRTPMQWDASAQAGFTGAEKGRLYAPVIENPPYGYPFVNVEDQLNDPQSLLNWMRRMIGVRKRFRAFGRGSMEMLLVDNSNIFVFIRRFVNENILVVVNLSGAIQTVHLPLSEFVKKVPLDLYEDFEKLPPLEWRSTDLNLEPYGYRWIGFTPPQVFMETTTARQPALSGTV